MLSRQVPPTSPARSRTRKLNPWRTRCRGSGLLQGDTILAVDGKSYPNVNSETRLERFFEDVGSHKCAGKQVDGCKAATPVTLRVRAWLSTSSIVETGMIFIPCFKGYSHRPDEFSSPEQMEKGVRVLAETFAELAGR